MYRLTIFIPYEGEWSQDFNNPEEIKDYLRKSKYSLDDVEINKIEYIDIYELMKD